MYLSLWRTAFSMLSLSFNLWANQNNTIHPVNPKGWGQRPFFISVAARGFDSLSNKHEENMDYRCKEHKYVLGKKLYMTMLNFL